MTAKPSGPAAASRQTQRLGQGVVLLATDGSADAAVARAAAVQLATRGGFALHIVHAWQVQAVVGGFPGYAAPPDFYEGCEEGGSRILEEESEKAQAEGAMVAGVHLIEGRPAPAIAEVAADVDATIVAMGSRGMGGLGRLVVGSVSEETLHCVHRPVLVLRGGVEAWPPVQIVAGDDGSANALAAATVAAQVAHILEVPVALTRVLPQLDEGGHVRGDVAGQVAAAQAQLQERAAVIRDRTGAEVRSRVVGGSPARSLLQSAEASAPALIVTGCRGAGLMTRMRFGSVSNRLLHGSQVPMLIVPAAVEPAAGHGGA